MARKDEDSDAITPKQQRTIAECYADGMVKVRFRTPDMDPETLWATPSSETAQTQGCRGFTLDNSPFYVYGASWKDVVEARPTDEPTTFEFARVHSKSGHATIRLASAKGERVSRDDIPQATLQPLLDLGCTHEGTHPGYLSVNIPPDADWNAVIEYLYTLDDSEVIWEHADPTYEEVQEGRGHRG